MANVTHSWAWGSYWAAPEGFRWASQAAPGVAESWNFSRLQEAFPDLNCARHASWTALRWELINLTKKEAASFATRRRTWQTSITLLVQKHMQGKYATSTSVEFLYAHGFKVCPLGIAALAAATWLGCLEEVTSFKREDGTLGQRFWSMVTEKCEASGNILQQATLAATKAARLNVLATLAATEWPILALLAAGEQPAQWHLHALHGKLAGSYRLPSTEVNITIQDGFCFSGFPRRQRSILKRFAEMVRSVAESARANFGSKWLKSSLEDDFGHQMVQMLQKRRDLSSDLPRLPLACQPLYFASCIFWGFVYAGDASYITEGDSSLRALLWESAPLGQLLLTMNFVAFPVFGFWRYFQSFVHHHMEAPTFPRSAKRLEDAFRWAFYGSRWRASMAFDYLFQLLPSNGLSETLTVGSAQQRSVVAVTSLWGTRHALRLPLWLKCVMQAGLAATIVLCHDFEAVMACQKAHVHPELCAFADEWPRSTLGKPTALALGLARGYDMLWLDMDVVLVRDPRPLLWPLRSPDAPPVSQEEEAPHLLLSVEGDSWNCVNAGLLLVRSTILALRFVALWLSMMILQPLYFDQQVLRHLLGLTITEMYSSPGYQTDWKRRLHMGLYSPQSDLFGARRTPPWGVLHPCIFAMTPYATWGGARDDWWPGYSGQIAAAHVLESFPTSRTLQQELLKELLEATSKQDKEALEEVLSLFRTSNDSMRARDCRIHAIIEHQRKKDLEGLHALWYPTDAGSFRGKWGNPPTQAATL
ncbi:HERC2 [Symbiodinium sp. CCMP2456]|nr:HERC2 [Symbiodinium sp. CCMP2456]